MTKTIDSLIEDIHEVLKEGVEGQDEVFEKFGRAMAEIMKSRLSKKEGTAPSTLRMSNMGSPCERKLYLEYREPEEKLPLNSTSKLKFLYGDLIEEMLLLLAELSGHTVEGRQDELEIAGIKGHRDAVIDGVLVDVKSASTYSFAKFRDGKLADNDPFGYVVQLQSYLYASREDPLVTDKDRAAFLVMDKTLGHITLDFHEAKTWNLDKAYKQRIEVMHGDDVPDRSFDDVEDGKSGNRKLDTFCSYCDVKYRCWPELRTFLSSKGPVYLTHTKREPKMYEVVKDESE